MAMDFQRKEGDKDLEEILEEIKMLAAEGLFSTIHMRKLSPYVVGILQDTYGYTVTVKDGLLWPSTTISWEPVRHDCA
jgi:hypothetical protein